MTGLSVRIFCRIYSNTMKMLVAFVGVLALCPTHYGTFGSLTSQISHSSDSFLVVLPHSFSGLCFSTVSLAVSKAGAASKGVPLYQHYADLAGNPNPDTLPVPCFNVINGGEHAGNKLAFQEFFVIPTGAENFKESMVIGCEVFHNLKKVIKGKFGGDATLIGDEGGFAPPCDVESGLEMIMEATAKAGYLDKVSVGLDVAASEFKVDGKNQYDLDFKSPAGEKNESLFLSGDELIEFYKKIIDDYPIVTIEDPFDQDDWDNWTKFCKEVGEGADCR